MNELTVTINRTDVAVKEYQGQRVVTLKEIDDVHQRPEGTAGRNFREHRERFIPDTDYFTLNQPDEIRRLGIERPQGGTPDSIIFITESGYLMLVKSFTDDLAWDVQRKLVDSYFRAKPSQPMSSLEIMRSMLDAQIQSENRLKSLESNVDHLEAKIQIAFEKPAVLDWCKWVNDKINLIVESQLLNHQTYRGDLYKELEQTAKCNLEARQTQLRRRMRESGHTVKECKAVSKLHIIDADPKLKAIFEGIVKRESARCA